MRSRILGLGVMMCGVLWSSGAIGGEEKSAAFDFENSFGGPSRAFTALDREALDVARTELMNQVRSQEMSLLAKYAYGEFGPPVYGALEIRLPLEWRVVTTKLTSADNLNGIAWQGTVFLQCPAVRFSEGSSYVASDIDPTAANWGVWVPRDVWQKPAVVVKLTNRDGRWVGQNQDGGIRLTVPLTMTSGQIVPIAVKSSASAMTPPAAAPSAEKGTARATQATSTTAAARATGQASAVSLVGRWIASGESKGKPYRYRFDFAEGVNGTLSGTFKYEPPGCKGRLVATAAAPPNYEFAVRIDDPLMLLKCGVSGVIFLHVKSPTEATMEEANASTGKVIGRISLVRKDADAGTTSAP